MYEVARRMTPALLAAIALLANAPVDAAAAHAPAKHGPHAVAAAVAEGDADDDGDIPAGAPTDDYGFTAWCYGALGEYLTIYDTVVPDLKDIDKMFGTSVQEDEPYSADVAAERDALKRFGAAIDGAERGSPQPITLEGVASIQAGRAIWAAAKLQPHRKLADAWLFWGIPRRCETAAKALKAHAHLAGPLMVRAWPSAIEIAAAEPAPTLDEAQAKALETPPAPPPPPPAGPPPHAGAVLIDGK
jgi:hypothetical protein